MNKNIYGVGQVNAYIQRMFAEDFLLRDIRIKGEVSNCKYHSSGHIYFTLKDAGGAISAILFRGNRVKGLRFPMKDGDKSQVPFPSMKRAVPIRSTQKRSRWMGQEICMYVLNS